MKQNVLSKITFSTGIYTIISIILFGIFVDVYTYTRQLTPKYISDNIIIILFTIFCALIFLLFTFSCDMISNENPEETPEEKAINYLNIINFILLIFLLLSLIPNKYYNTSSYITSISGILLLLLLFINTIISGNTL